jgi:hypothetical protein
MLHQHVRDTVSSYHNAGCDFVVFLGVTSLKLTTRQILMYQLPVQLLVLLSPCCKTSYNTCVRTNNLPIMDHTCEEAAAHVNRPHLCCIPCCSSRHVPTVGLAQRPARPSLAILALCQTLTLKQRHDPARQHAAW